MGLEKPTGYYRVYAIRTFRLDVGKAIGCSCISDRKVKYVIDRKKKVKAKRDRAAS